MIFVTVGSDLPFDRLVKIVDKWAADEKRTDVFAQIGRTAWRPMHIPFQHFLTPEEFQKRVSAADVIISHAGMGTILTCLRWRKPLLVMPRRANLREVRNEHQLATSKRLVDMGKIQVAFDDKELRAWLDRLGELEPQAQIGHYASEQLLNALRQFIGRS